MLGEIGKYLYVRTVGFCMYRRSYLLRFTVIRAFFLSSFSVRTNPPPTQSGNKEAVVYNYG